METATHEVKILILNTDSLQFDLQETQQGDLLATAE